jgi:hypothetical protein
MKKFCQSAATNRKRPERWEEMKMEAMSDGSESEVSVECAGNVRGMRFEAPGGCEKMRFGDVCAENMDCANI